MKICAFDNCEKPHNSRGYCRTHYQLLLKRGVLKVAFPNRGNGRRKHAASNTSEYHIWTTMKGRCYTPTSNRYHYYGGRGIKVCDRWRDSFENFLADMGPRPKKQSLDRIDNDGDYEPDNCRWATQSEQCRNSRRSRRVTINGESLTAGDLASRMRLHLH